jgi:hypothetical protein
MGWPHMTPVVGPLRDGLQQATLVVSERRVASSCVEAVLYKLIVLNPTADLWRNYEKNNETDYYL